MYVFDLPPVVQNLATLGESWEKPAQWKDYRALGITPEHIPALILIVEHAEEFWDDDTSASSWLPIHAWRALGQLQADEAMPALIRTLPWIDEYDNDMVQEDLPDVFGMIGSAAVSGLADFLENTTNPLWARVAAAEGLKNIGLRYQETHGVAIETLLRALSYYAKNHYALNSFLINYLSDLQAIDGAPLIERAFQSGRVDEDIAGDWEDYQVAVGLLAERLTPRGPGNHFSIAFSDGLSQATVVDQLQQAPVVAPGEVEKSETKKNKKARFQHKHAANQYEKPEKASGKHKLKEAKLRHKKSGKKK